jgi:CRISPR type I-E-associated protein CasB/Cse2
VTNRTQPRPADRLVRHLIYLADTVDSVPESRAALAELRRGLTEPLRIARHVVPYLPEGRFSPDRETWLYFIASLFALHRNHADGVSLGSAFRHMKGDSDSIEGRFLALLSAKPDHLDTHLRHAIRLLASRGVPLDWYRLANDIVHWDDEGKRKQHQLARDFYRTVAAEESTDDNSESEGEPNP